MVWKHFHEWDQFALSPVDTLLSQTRAYMSYMADQLPQKLWDPTHGEITFFQNIYKNKYTEWELFILTRDVRSFTLLINADRQTIIEYANVNLFNTSQLKSNSVRFQKYLLILDYIFSSNFNIWWFDVDLTTSHYFYNRHIYHSQCKYFAVMKANL